MDTGETGDYQIIRSLGEGSFGVVTLGLQDGKEFAFKRITLENSISELYSEREIHALLELDHPNIIKCLDVYYSKDFIEIKMPYYKDGDLESYQAKCGDYFDEAKVFKIGKDISSGLAYMHGKNYMHRDLKPKNILVDSANDTCVISDCGSAVDIANSRNTITGTRGFMAPEIISRKAYDNKVDIYSFGCVFYDLCYKDYEFRRIKDVQKGVFPPHKFQVSGELRNLIQKCLSSDPRLRPSATELYSFFDKKHATFNEERALRYQNERNYDLAIREFEGLLRDAISKNGEISNEVARFYSLIANVYLMKNDSFMSDEYLMLSSEISYLLRPS